MSPICLPVPRATSLVLLVTLLVAVSAVAPADEAPRLLSPDWGRVEDTAPAPELAARAALLFEVDSRTVLHAKSPDLVLPPASLTKLVAIDAALDALDHREIALTDTFVPPEASWAENQSPGSSLMFLGPDQRLSWRDLLLGISVSSGNDAAVALALLLDGGVPAFADRMNRRAAALGLVDLFFVEPSGLSPRNTITARGFARFLLAHLDRFPYALDELYRVRTFTYPDERHRAGPRAREPITQSNRNTLLWEYAGADGFKTGFIDESGYHLAATAERDGRRLVAIVLGIDADSHAAGGALRAGDAAALLDYGFTAFRRLEFDYPAPQPVRVYGGSVRELVPSGPERLVITVPAGAASRVRGVLEQELEVRAPFDAVEVGRVAIELDGVELAGAPLVLAEVERGGFFRRVWAAIVAFFRSVGELFGGEGAPVPGGELAPAAI
ncbi:MAG: D-alanyl-D-alanine carboxypeptidase family protein [Spirochaetota bacterium]